MDLILSGFRSKKPLFDPATEIPSLAGKVILVTGGTAGLGRESILSFAQHAPAHIFFTGRSQASADTLVQEVRAAQPAVPITFLACDLASFASIQTAARTLVAATPRLDILMANAGVLMAPPGVTQSGYEVHFGTNHMGHALLAKLLLPLLAATPGARVVWTTSLAARLAPAPGIAFGKLRSPQTDIAALMAGWRRYGQSKLANLLYARAFARRHPAVVSVAVHPGVSITDIGRTMSRADVAFVYATTPFARLAPHECAWNQQWAATAPVGPGEREVVSGGYYEPVAQKGKLGGYCADDALADELWDWTQKELEGYEL